MSKKYLNYFPKPLLSDLIAGRWLPVLGAGMSVNAKVPVGKKMPLWPDLGEILAADISDYEASGTVDSISAYQHEFGRASLIERLTEVLLVAEAQPGDTHRAFCSMSFDIVCTTNFDFLLERQYDLTPRYVYPVVDEDQLSINGSAAGTLLLKLHGDLRHPTRLIVTEEDYDAFLGKYPLIATYLANQLITKSAVFIGYSLDDPDFRQISSIVSERLGRSRRLAYSIMVDARPSDVTRFERRGVKVINLPGNKTRYGEVLAAAFDELREYVRDNVLSASQVTEEDVLQELQLPRDSVSRLCFFSLPLEMLAQYRSVVFPLVESLGYVPVTADDVVSAGDNVNAKLDALIERAAVMIVELSSQWTRAEFDIAIASKKRANNTVLNRIPLKIIVVSDGIELVPLPADVLHVVRSGRLLADGNEREFLSELARVLGQASEGLGDVAQAISEPKRLLQAGENRAAIIAAMSRVETWLRQSLEKAPWEQVQRPMSLRQLLERASEQNILSRPEVASLIRWNHIRNEAVHTGKAVTRAEAGQIVSGVERIVARN